MPKIQLTTPLASPSISNSPGDIIDVSQAEFDRLIAAGYGIVPGSDPTIFTAVEPMAEVKKAIKKGK